MIQSEILHNSWISTNQIDDPFYEYQNYSSLNSKDQDSSEISFSDFTSIFPDYDVFTDLPIDDMEFVDVSRWLNDSENEGNDNMKIPSETRKDAGLNSPALSSISIDTSTTIPSRNSSTISSPLLPQNSREMDTLCNLLLAYGEAIENGHKELAQVIKNSIKGKINPLGESLERVASNLFNEIEEDQESYLKQESNKILEVAFKAFYQIFPLGKFAHFAANSAIVEAVPDDAENVHIIDYDMGKGIQWPPIIEAMSQKRKALRFTSIKPLTGSDSESISDELRFEETKRRLLDYANSLGLTLQVDEMTFEELASELRRMKKRGKRSEWLVFNLMFKLPHMGKRTRRIDALEFLKLAKELLLANSSTHKGLITFGDGEAIDNNSHEKSNNTYSSFFNKKLIHYQSIFESLELYFPSYISQARLAMESLFLAPQVCSFSWFQNWEEMTSSGCDSYGEIGLQGMKVSKENLLQAKEVVNERETLLKVRIEEKRQNEMVLEWKGTSLIRVSIWM